MADLADKKPIIKSAPELTGAHLSMLYEIDFNEIMLMHGGIFADIRNEILAFHLG